MYNTKLAAAMGVSQASCYFEWMQVVQHAGGGMQRSIYSPFDQLLLRHGGRSA